MQFGVCGSPEIATIAAAAGYDFFEGYGAGLLCPFEPEAEFQKQLANFRLAPLPCPALNCLLPGDLKVVGPEVDTAKLTDYATTACRRAREAGVNVIVFGSGGARRIPDGWERPAAWVQLQQFGTMLAGQAGQNGVTIAVEPLNRKECNVLNTVGECADLVRAVAHPAFRLLVDGFHWALDGDSAEAIATNGNLLAHTHIATVPNRLAPGAEECDLAPFFRALAAGGYDGRISIEGNLQDPQVTLPRALTLMRRLVAMALR
jgi:sugar phosphate isomerase/epimerase